MTHFPTRQLLMLALAPIALSTFLCFEASLLIPLLICDAAIIILVLFDALWGVPTARQFTCSLHTAEVWSHNKPEEVAYRLDNHDRRTWHLEIAPDLPRCFQVEDPRWHVDLPARRRAAVTFIVRPRRRGRYLLHGLHLSCRSRLGFWKRRLQLGPDRQILVYPNLKQLSEYALLARTDRLSLIGVRTSRQVGGDTEFERLRDYQSDDPLGRIDWKATARRNQLTVRDYQISQSQSIVFLLDAGRMMVARSDRDGEDAGSLFDQAIDAALMLAHVALRRGDRVGLIAYADGIKRYVPVKGGPRHLNALIHAVHDLEPTMVESRHDEAFLFLAHKERKRSLSVLLTHVIDDVNVAMLERHLNQLGNRHLPLAVCLRDPAIHRPLAIPPVDEAGFWHAAAAAHVANWRTEALKRFRAAGALIVDVDAGSLTATLVNRYLEIKAKHWL